VEEKARGEETGWRGIGFHPKEGNFVKKSLGHVKKGGTKKKKKKRVHKTRWMPPTGRKTPKNDSGESENEKLRCSTEKGSQKKKGLFCREKYRAETDKRKKMKRTKGRGEGGVHREGAPYSLLPRGEPLTKSPKEKDCPRKKYSLKRGKERLLGRPPKKKKKKKGTRPWGGGYCVSDKKGGLGENARERL